MKKIINGKRYDTDAARKVADGDCNYGRTDFQWYDEALYCKRTGEYFLAGEGGPASKYCRPAYGGGWTGGEKIIPLTRAEAMQWGERYMSVDDYEAEFGVIEETPVPSPLGSKIRTAREASGLSQLEAAKRIGTTQQVWAQYEAGQVDPTVSRLIEMANALGVRAAELLDS